MSSRWLEPQRGLPPAATANRQSAVLLDRPKEKPDRHRDADRPCGGCGRAREAGEHRMVVLEEQERADGEREEQRVAVARAVQVPRVGVQREARDGDHCGPAFEP